MGTSVDKGLPLFPAIRTFSDPVAWAELENLLSVKVDPAEKGRWTPNDWAKHDFSIKLPLGLALPGSGSAVRLKHLQDWHRWVKLRTGFHKRLQSGELVATGYVKPVKHDDHRIVIDPDMWGFLEPDFRDSTASGGGMEVIHVAVHPPGSEASAISGELAASETPEESPDPFRTGFAGRPTAKDVILAEHRRRIEAGEASEVLAREAEYLADWLPEAHPTAPPTTVLTIKNRIRGQHNAWKSSKATAEGT